MATKGTSKKTKTTSGLAASAALQGSRTEYRIYPPIGIARIGDSRNDYFIGPESPGIAPKGPFRDKNHALKPQGARFRIYEIEITPDGKETVKAEVTANPDVQIEWRVELANRKAAGNIITDLVKRPPILNPRNGGYDRKGLVIHATDTISQKDKTNPPMVGEISFIKTGILEGKKTSVELATLRTIDNRLVVVGGPGISASPIGRKLTGSYTDNDGWYDSVSDGPVTAAITIGNQTVAAVPAWVVVTVPRYAPSIYGIVTWYDQAVNLANKVTNNGSVMVPKPSFTHDIYPILKRVQELAFVSDQHHQNSFTPAYLLKLDQSGRESIFARLVEPGTPAIPVEGESPHHLLPKDEIKNMPKLYAGANPDPNVNIEMVHASLTPYQYEIMRRWKIGDFYADWPGEEPTPPNFDEIPLQAQPEALTRAALEACVGAPFFPGVEGTYDIARASSYEGSTFRINRDLNPGFLTEKMALPWQADFMDCAAEGDGGHWWPSQRPDISDKGDWARGISDADLVTRHQNMVDKWQKLGFITKENGKFTENEREL